MHSLPESPGPLAAGLRRPAIRTQSVGTWQGLRDREDVGVSVTRTFIEGASVFVIRTFIEGVCVGIRTFAVRGLGVSRPERNAVTSA